jgi:ABC-type phosphate/phosphonate transport system substrate-binding protein
MLRGASAAGWWITLVLLAIPHSQVFAKKNGHVKLAYTNKDIDWYDRQTLQSAVSRFTGQMARRVGGTVSVAAVSTVADLVAKLRAKEVDMCVASLHEYGQIADQVDVVPIARPVRFGRGDFKVLVVVRRSSNIRSLAQLRGKSLTYNAKERTNEAFLRVSLDRIGVRNPAAFFSSISNRRKSKSSALEVFMGEVDACIVRDTILHTMAELNPQIRRQLAVIHASETFPTTPMVARTDIPKVVTNNTQQVLLSAHKDKTGKQLLRLFKIDTHPAYHHENSGDAGMGQEVVTYAPTRYI